MANHNLVPRAFPLKNGWEKPWGRGWANQSHYVGERSDTLITGLANPTNKLESNPYRIFKTFWAWLRLD